jgi:hypothetical protein
MDGKRHKQRQIPKNQQDEKNMGGDQRRKHTISTD